MPALDTNVLVRLLVDDDPAQARAAARLIEQAVRTQAALFVPVTVLLELEWVLRSAYGFDKPAVLDALAGLLGAWELRFEAESAVETARNEYAGGDADFADCLHVALALQAGEPPLWTFDRSAAKVGGARLLT